MSNANGFFSQAAMARSSLGSAATDAYEYGRNDAPVTSYSFDPEYITAEIRKPPVTVESGRTVFITELRESIPTWAWVAGGFLGVGLAVALFKGKK